MWARRSATHPDGICLDADGAVWYADVANRRCVRVREGGEVLQTIESRPRLLRLHARRSGWQGRLFMLAAEWRGFEHADEAIADRTGQVLVADAPAPRAGWP